MRTSTHFQDLLSYLVAHGIAFCFGILIFLALFQFKNLWPNQIFFYKGVAYCIVAGFMASLCMSGLKLFFPQISWKDLIISFLLTTPLLLVFFTHIPVTADRSLTIFTLGYMDKNHNKSFSSKDLEKELIESYIVEYRAVDKRIAEQLASGTIEATSTPGYYKISKRGENLMQSYRAMAPLFGLDCHLCGGQKNKSDQTGQTH
jgi:hypothetical protein